MMEIQPGPVNWGAYNPLLLPGTVRMWLYHTFPQAEKLHAPIASARSYTAQNNTMQVSYKRME
ncbi:hypothetical protein [Pedobacter sp. NJ-S-72]